MKTAIKTLWNSLLIAFLATLSAGQAHGQIYVTNFSSGTIGAYNANTGATVNTSLVSGLNRPQRIAVSGANLFVVNYRSGTIGKYNVATGAPVNASLVSGLSGPAGIAVNGNDLFVTNYTSGTIGEYNATTGLPVKAPLVSGLNQPLGIAVSGANLFVTNFGSGTIGEYNATTGLPVKAPLVSGLSGPAGIAVNGNDLFVTNYSSGTIGEYNATTGMPVKAPLVSGLSGPEDIAVSGTNLFVTNFSSGTIGEYNATTGATVKASLFSGLNDPVGIAAGATPTGFNYLTTVPLPSNSWGAVTVNEALNKIYTSGNPSSNTNIEVFVIDGYTFALKDVGYGSEVSVDNKTNNYWAATIFGNGTYPPGVIVRDGTIDSVVEAVDLGYCPIATAYDFLNSRMWVGAQCGPNNDPVFAIDADSFGVINPPGTISSGGTMGSIIANGANGRLYLYEPEQGLSERVIVNPTTFTATVTQNAFGDVSAINGVTNTLYALSGNTLQIINGAPDPEGPIVPITLSYTPGSMGVNTAFNYLYIANPAGNSIEVRDGSTGALVSTFSLSALGITPNGAMDVDSTRGRIYVIQNPSSGSVPVLLVIEDLVFAAVTSHCIRSH